VVVLDLDPRDRLRGLLLTGHPLDDAVVVEAVLGDERLGVDPLEGVLEVLRRDLAVDRRRELHAGLQVERPRQPVGRGLPVGCDVRDDLVARDAGGVRIRHQVPQ
jgi:hypothetical protein